MPKTKSSVQSYVEPHEFREVVLDIERYPEFLEDVKKVEILEDQDDMMLATFWVEVALAGVEVKTEYTVRYQIEDWEIRWSLESSPDLTINEGEWRFEVTEDDETLVHYEAEIVTSLPIPPELQTLFAEEELPKMLGDFRDRVESL